MLDCFFAKNNLEMFKANILVTFLHKNLEMTIEKVLEIIFTRKNLEMTASQYNQSYECGEGMKVKVIK